MQLKNLFFALFIFLGFSCSTPKIFTPDSFEGKMLTFGSEGGFAGTTAENYIFENGQLYSFESKNGNLIEQGRIDQSIVNQIFDTYETFGIGDLQLNDPGNLSYFIKMKTADGEKMIKWGGMNAETPPIVKQYFKNLGQIARKYKNVTQ